MSASERRRHFSPAGLPPPPGNYHHGVISSLPGRVLTLSGQLAIGLDGSVPDGIEAQTQRVFDAIDTCLREAEMSRADIVRLLVFLLDPADRPGYMAVRDRWVAEPAPASTLVFISALADPRCLIEVEATAIAS